MTESQNQMCPKCQNTNNECFIYSFEISKGTVEQQNQQLLKKNTYSSRKYRWMTIFPRASFIYFSCNKYVSMICMLMLIQESIFRQYWMYMVTGQVVLWWLVFVVGEVWTDMGRARMDVMFNERVYVRLGGDKVEGEMVKSMDLRVGDVIELKEQQVVPADLLILDTDVIKDKNSVCYVQASSLQGSNELQIRYACKLTQTNQRSSKSSSFREFRKTLTGTLQYRCADRAIGQFDGLLQLKRDPKVEQLTGENLLLAGSVLVNTERVVGVVVFTGENNKIHLNSNYQARKTLVLKRYLDALYELSLGLCVCLALISLFVVIAHTKTMLFIKQIDENAASNLRFIGFLILFVVFLPIHIQGVIDLCLRWLNRRTEESYRGKSILSINGNSGLANLGAIQYALLDKTGVITSGSLEMDHVLCLSKMYNVRRERPQLEGFVDEGMSVSSSSNHSYNSLDINDKDLVSQISKDSFDEESNYLQMETQDITQMKSSNLEVKNSMRQNNQMINSFVNFQQTQSEITYESKAQNRSKSSKDNRSITVKENKKLNIEDQNNQIKSRDQMKDANSKSIIIKHNTSDSFKLTGETNKIINIGSKKSGAILSEMRTMKRKNIRLADNKMKTRINTVNNNFDSFREEALRQEKNIHNLLMAAVICHDIKSYYKQKSNDPLNQQRELHFQAEHKEELFINNFCKQFGYRFMMIEKDNKNEYIHIVNQCKNLKQKFKVDSRNIAQDNERLSVIVEPIDQLKNVNKSGILICKGEPSSMMKRLATNNDGYNVLEITNLITRMQKQGLKVIVFAKRILNPDEYQAYQKKFISLRFSLKEQKEELQQFVQSVETNMEFVGFFAYFHKVQKGITKVVKLFEDIDVKTWMVSGDKSPFNCQMAAYRSGIIDMKKHQPFVIQGNSYDSIFKELVLILSEVNFHHCKKQMKKIHFVSMQDKKGNDISNSFMIDMNELIMKEKKKEYQLSDTAQKFLNARYLLVDGKSLDIIFSNKSLKANFQFICQLVDKLIGFRLSAVNKRQLVQVIQKDFLGSPSVLSIGDSHNDTLMMQESAVSIQKINMKKGKQTNMMCTGDIMLSDLELIPVLMKVEGRHAFDKTTLAIDLLSQFNYILGFQVFFFNWYASFTGSMVMDARVILSLQMTNLVSVVGIVLQRSPDMDAMNNRHPLLYAQGLITLREISKSFVSLFVESFIIAAGIFYTSLYCMYDSVSAEGYSSNLTWLRTLLTLSCVVYSVLTSIQQSAKISLVIGNVVCWSICLLFLQYTDSSSTISIELWTVLLMTSMVIYVLLVVLFSEFKQWVSPSVVQVLQNLCFKEEHWNTIHQRGHSLVQASKESMGSIVKNAFYKQNVKISNLIEEIINPNDINQGELSINKRSLQMLEYSKEIRYCQSKQQVNRVFFRNFVLFGIGILGVYLFFALLGSQMDMVDRMVLVQWLVIGCVGTSLFMERFKANFWLICKVMFMMMLISKCMYDQVTLSANAQFSIILTLLIFNVNVNLPMTFIYALNALYIFNFIVKQLISYYQTESIFYQGSTQIKDTNFTQLLNFCCNIQLTLLTWFLQLVLLHNNYMGEKDQRLDFLSNQKINNQKEQLKGILGLLVPEFVQEYLQSNNKKEFQMEEEYENVDIVFCDIVGFDDIIKIEKEKTVEILDSLFRAFDDLCQDRGLQKIETVGKTYMAATNLRTQQKTPVVRLATDNNLTSTEQTIKLAFDMMEHIENFTYGDGQQIQIKIGIHTGKVIAGVIGFHKPQFSLIGDTVNTCSRVGSTGQDGSITISHQSYLKVQSPNIYKFKRKVVQAKGKGDMVTYQVTLCKKQEDVSIQIIQKDSKKLSQITLPHIYNIKESDEQSDNGESSIRLIHNNQKKRRNKTNVNKTDVQKNSQTNLNLLHQGDAMTFNDFKINSSNKTESYIQNDEEIKPLSSEFIDLKFFKLNTKQMKEIQDKKVIDQVQDDQMTKKKTMDDEIFEIPIDKCITNKNSLDIYFYFYNKTIDDSLKILKLFSFLYIISSSLMTTISSTINYNMFYYIIRVVFLVNNLIIILILDKCFFISNYLWISFFQVIFGLSLSFIQCLLQSINQIVLVQIIESTCSLVIYTSLSHFRLNQIILINVFWIFQIMLTYFFRYRFDLAVTLQILAFVIINFIRVYYSIKLNFDSFFKVQYREQVQNQQEQLVSQLLPKHAFEKLKNFKLTMKIELTDQLDNVTILFADIAGFTAYSSSVTPSDVVNMLRTLFERFDKMCLKHQVFKLYTIGDCYVILGIIDNNNRNPAKEAQNIIEMGFDMIDIIQQVKVEINFQGLEMRIGVHTGNIIGGIIGTELVRYDIYGKDVSMANKMESNGVNGQIMISETTRELLERRGEDVDEGLGYSFVYHAKVECKAFDHPLKSYIVYRQQEESQLEDNMLEDKMMEDQMLEDQNINKEK